MERKSPRFRSRSLNSLAFRITQIKALFLFAGLSFTLACSHGIYQRHPSSGTPPDLTQDAEDLASDLQNDESTESLALAFSLKQKNFRCQRKVRWMYCETSAFPFSGGSNTSPSAPMAVLFSPFLTAATTQLPLLQHLHLHGFRRLDRKGDRDLRELTESFDLTELVEDLQRNRLARTRIVWIPLAPIPQASSEFFSSFATLAREFFITADAFLNQAQGKFKEQALDSQSRDEATSTDHDEDSADSIQWMISAHSGAHIPLRTLLPTAAKHLRARLRRVILLDATYGRDNFPLAPYQAVQALGTDVRSVALVNSPTEAGSLRLRQGLGLSEKEIQLIDPGKLPGLNHYSLVNRYLLTLSNL